MDPPTLINQPSFPTTPNANPNITPFNLSEIWHFPIHGGTSVEDSGPALALRMAHLAHNLTHFGDIAIGNPEVSPTDPVPLQLQQRLPHGHGVSKKRRDSEQDSPKVSSTSNGNNANANSSAGVFV